ncbi:DUF488 domain-containing protein [Tessaracoccus rhinocerotis]|uniref:DUF488 domain-containing protein n=1 Tax=Tessaracoccus rhinocerotis TaxID=1689449 RepID=A0A553K5X6_9ACTN|nr:DUF488 domain-containing protein [Tessaracoccus rhinocerotis]TRY20062.1 DUF488 domain-containing protein [Tessaracoccus rhinocerotis]
MNAFFTIGHSNRELDEFVGLLGEHSIEVVVDVRRLPGSRRYPQFDQDTLAAALDGAGIAYQWSKGLTGRRAVSKEVGFEVNAWWENRSFHNYADHALSDEFQQALAELVELGGTRRSTVMCSEAVWWRCHRRLISDNLLARGLDVRHVVGSGRAEAAKLTEGAVVAADAVVTYPAEQKSPGPREP